MRARAAIVALTLLLNVDLTIAEVPMPLRNAEVAKAWQQALEGDFSGAEQKLKQLIDDLDAPATTDAAIVLEQLRRKRIDYSLSPEAMLNKLKRSIPDAKSEDLERWREAGELQYLMIDGAVRYFGREPVNLFRFSEEAKSRRVQSAEFAGSFDLATHAAELLKRARPDTPYIFPVRHNIKYQITIPKDHPRLKHGAKISVWMPFPQVHDQQGEVKLHSVSSEALLAESGAAHRSLYFEKEFEKDFFKQGEDQEFTANFSFTTYAKVPVIDEAKIEPYDTASDIYRTFTAERPPHIVLDQATRDLAAEIVGDEKNAYRKARLVFRWVYDNIKYCAEQEYSTIPNLSAKALEQRKGDCGVQALTFVTLCRAAGVPARWQSGFQTFPNNSGLHDWAEFYVEPYGWLPCDPSYGVLDHPDPAVQDFLCGRMDPWRWIVNLDYGRAFIPPKNSFRSEPTDFQRGEVEIDGHNLYFGEWRWRMQLSAEPLDTDYHSMEMALDDRVPGWLRAGKIPGAVIHVGKRTPTGDFVTWEKAYGYRSFVPERTTMTTDTVFDMASLTKPLSTGLLMLHLADAGMVSLSDPVSKFLPEFAQGSKAGITIGHLLSHRAGLPAYLSQESRTKLKAAHGAVCAEPTRAEIRSIGLSHTPGTKRQYSCLSAILSAEVIEEISGKPIEVLFDEVIAQPLGRESLGYARDLPSERFAPTTPRHPGESPLAGVVHDPLAGMQDGLSGNAGLFGTADDIAAIAQLILSNGERNGKPVLTPGVIQRLTKHVPSAKDSDHCENIDYAWLWQRREECATGSGLDQYRSLAHTGYTGTMLRIYPQLGTYVIVLTNRVHPDDGGKVSQFRSGVLETVSRVKYTP